MSEKRWKANERAIAKTLGGQRVPVTGRARGDAPDVAHPRLSIECKSRNNLPAWLKEAMAQANAAAKLDQLAIVVLHEVGQRHSGDLVIVELKSFKEWFGGEDEE